MGVSSKQAEYRAIAALVLTVIFAMAAFIAGAFCRSFAIYSLSIHLFGTGFIWLVLVIMFHQRSLAEREKLDMAQLSQAESTETIFQASSDQESLFAVAQKRLEVLEKWFVPIFAILIAAYQITFGIILLNRVKNALDIVLYAPRLGAIFMAGVAFSCFLISRYVTGMSAEERWRPLRAGGSYLLSVAIVSFLLAISLALAQFKILIGMTILAWAIPILLIVLGCETALNVIFDIYRPRIRGQYNRCGFDSRLLGVINEPGGIFHTFASMIDYQFGFQVSQTWFYKLLEKAVLPLVLFSVLTLYSLSCIVIVEPGDQAIIEHAGQFDENSVVGPGWHWKLPWPFEIARIYTTSRIQQISVGFEEEEHERVEPILWAVKHHDQEYTLLVGTKTDGIQDEEGAVPVSIVVAAVPVQYRIKDLYSYVSYHSDAGKVLEMICHRELAQFAASAKIETEGPSASESLLGAGRKAAASELSKRIQAAADEEKLGVEIVFLGLQGVHPPIDVAKDYQRVIGAIQKKQESILHALADRNRVLVSFSGSVSQANKLYELAREYQEAKESNDEERIENLSGKIDEAFAMAQGVVFQSLSEAKSYAFEKGILAEAVGKRFNDQIRAYHASPELYKKQYRLAMLEEALKDVRKYIVIAEGEDAEVFVIDLQEKLAPSLYDLNLDEIGE